MNKKWLLSLEQGNIITNNNTFMLHISTFNVKLSKINNCYWYILIIYHIPLHSLWNNLLLKGFIFLNLAPAVSSNASLRYVYCNSME